MSREKNCGVCSPRTFSNFKVRGVQKLACSLLIQCIVLLLLSYFLQYMSLFVKRYYKPKAVYSSAKTCIQDRSYRSMNQVAL